MGEDSSGGVGGILSGSGENRVGRIEAARLLRAAQTRPDLRQKALHLDLMLLARHVARQVRPLGLVARDQEIRRDFLEEPASQARYRLAPAHAVLAARDHETVPGASDA